MNYRTPVIIPVLAVQSGDGMGGETDVLVHRDL